MIRDYWELGKPRVVFLMLITSWVGMGLATHTIAWEKCLWASLGIALCSMGSAAFNHAIEIKIDQLMQRTQFRPVAAGRIRPSTAGLYAALLISLGTFILWYYVNTLTTVLTFVTAVGYAFVYTGFLKRATPQNIVIGGLTGALPPLLGWTAVANHIDPYAWLLVLIIFTWTPPHFWALAIFREEDYARSPLPMLTKTHGIAFTKTAIVLYTWLLTVVTLLPYLTGMSGIIYLGVAVILDSLFLYHVYKLWRTSDKRAGYTTFTFSIQYLGLLFLGLLLDHYLRY